MLKKFFISFLGSIAAIWLSAMILFVLAIVFIAGIIGSSASTVEIGEHSILYLQLSGNIPERRTSQDVSDLLLNGGSAASVSFEEIMRSLQLAASDDRIDGVYIDCADSDLGYASRAELRDAIQRFKASSGKWVLAYGDNYTQGDYYVATVADSVYLNPVGNIDIHGLASSVPYFKEALDKIGVNVQVFKVGTYKSAVEPFMLNTMSEPARLQTQLFLDSIWANTTNDICKARKITAPAMAALTDSLTFGHNVQWCRDKKLIDKAAYRRQVEDVLCALTGTEDADDLALVSPRDYLSDYDAVTQSAADGQHIAVVVAEGDITDDGKEGIVAASLVPEILSLAKDENVAGMVLRVNSGGGSAFASEQIWDAVRQFKAQGKPVYVSMGDYAASGGYYISCGADRIYASRQTLTGSIGIFGIIPSAQGTFEQHLGIHFSTVKTGDNATPFTIAADMNGHQKAEMQRYIQRGYDTFLARVAEGRHLAKDSVDAIAQGRVWDGATALRIGLVDRIGTLHDAIADLAKEIGISQMSYAVYPYADASPFEQLLSAMGGTAAMPQGLREYAAMAAMTPQEAYKALRLVRRITTMSPIQARMEDITLK